MAIIRSGFRCIPRILNNLRVDEQQRFWIVYQEAIEDVCDIKDDKGQERMEVKIAFSVSHNTLTSAEEYI